MSARTHSPSRQCSLWPWFPPAFMVESQLQAACGLHSAGVQGAAARELYKAEPAGWKQSQPGDAYSKGRWWELYNDPALNALEEQPRHRRHSTAPRPHQPNRQSPRALQERMDPPSPSRRRKACRHRRRSAGVGCLQAGHAQNGLPAIHPRVNCLHRARHNPRSIRRARRFTTPLRRTSCALGPQTERHKEMNNPPPLPRSTQSKHSARTRKRHRTKPPHLRPPSGSTHPQPLPSNPPSAICS